MERISLVPDLQLFDAREVRGTLQLLLAPEQVTELRILDAVTGADRWPHIASGYFDDPEKLISALELVRTAKAFYFIPSPVNPALLARAANRNRNADKGGTAGDGDIQARRWLLIDCDPQRPAGISATNIEHEAALERCETIWSALHFNYGWPEPIAADSGNGAHLLYRVDLPVDDAGLVQRCLMALAAQFDDAVVNVDTGVFNPARIWKLYGTWACKGDSTEDRPHRMSRILSKPDSLVIVSREQLEILAGEAPAAATHETNGAARASGISFYIDAFIHRHGLELDEPVPYQGGRKWTFRQSPLCEHHSDGPYLIQFASGALSADCHHNSFSWSWRDLREKYELKSDSSLYDRLVAKTAGKTSSNGAGSSLSTTRDKPLERIKFAELRKAHPTLNAPVVDGLLRFGETSNIISYSKVGKSWLAYGLTLDIITGGTWFGRFITTKGRVLYIDNELHKSTIANRFPAVARAKGIADSVYESNSSSSSSSASTRMPPLFAFALTPPNKNVARRWNSTPSKIE